MSELDPDQVQMLRGLRNGTLLPQLMQVYRAQAERDLAALRAAVAGGDFTAARGIAHGLKSASLNVGARQVGELAAQLEAGLRAGATADAGALVQSLADAYGRCRPELEALS